MVKRPVKKTKVVKNVNKNVSKIKKTEESSDSDLDPDFEGLLDSDNDSDDLEDDDSMEATLGSKKLAEKMRLIMESGELDSDDDDDSDEDDDESEDDEDLAPPAKKQKQSPGKKAEKETPKSSSQGSAKKGQKRKSEDDDDEAEVTNGKKQKVSNTEVAKKEKVSATALAEDKKVQADRDGRTLFIKNLPMSIKEKTLKGLFTAKSRKSIVEVRLRTNTNAKKTKRKKFAYVEFQEESDVAAGYAAVQGKEVEGEAVVVDYVGQKSMNKQHNSKTEDPANYDPLRLYVTGFGRRMKLADLQKLFKGHQKVQLPVRKNSNLNVGFAFVHYSSEKACKEARDSMQGHWPKYSDKPLVVLYAKKTTQEKKSDFRPQQLEAKVKAKQEKKEKQKRDKKEKKKKGKKAAESSSEEDDDDEDSDADDVEDLLDDEAHEDDSDMDQEGGEDSDGDEGDSDGDEGEGDSDEEQDDSDVEQDSLEEDDSDEYISSE